MKTTRRQWDTERFRLIGVLPIIIFIARLIQYIQVGAPDWIVASCHISNLMLGVGMVFGAPLLVRVATIWLIIGLPMWIIDAVVTRDLWWSSIYSHVGGFLIGLYAITKTRATGRSWLPALIWFVILQMITRYTTAVTPYSKNTRTVTVIDTDVEGGSQAGLVAMIEVTALMIGQVLQCYSRERYESPRPVTVGMFVERGCPKSLYRPGSSTDALLFQRGRVAFDEDLIDNLRRRDARSRFSQGFGRPLVETEVTARSRIAVANSNEETFK
jgi:Phosphatidylserine decarboxylase